MALAAGGPALRLPCAAQRRHAPHAPPPALRLPAAPARRRRAPRATQRPAASAGPGSPLSRAVDAVGAWLVAHPAPLWLVNNPLKRWYSSRMAGEYDAPAASAALDALIAADDVVLFSATYCPFSAKAKAELRAQGLPFAVHEVNKLPNGNALVAELGKRTGRTSIPHIYIGGESVGGCNDGTPGLRPLIASGGLEAALARCSPGAAASWRAQADGRSA
jgi:glutaredoxin 3